MTVFDPSEAELYDATVLDSFAAMIGEGGDSAARQLVETFEVEARELVAVIEDEESDESVQRAAHTLKSSSRSVGALALGDLAASIDAAARQGDLGGAEHELALLSWTFRATLAALNLRLSG